MAWYQRSYSDYFEKSFRAVLIDDYLSISNNIKKNGLIFFLILLLILPVFYPIYLFYLFLTLFYYTHYLIFFVYNFLKSFFIKKKDFKKIIIYNFPKNEQENNFLLIIFIINNFAKKQAFMLLYFTLKKKTFSKNFFFLFILNFFLRLVFNLLIGFNAKFVKISVIFLDIFFKNYKKNRTFNKVFFEELFIDFFLIYNDFYNNFVKKSKIIIKNKNYFLNPKNNFDLLVNILKNKCNLSYNDYVQLMTYIEIIRQNSLIRYNALREYVNKNDIVDCYIDENNNYYIGEKTPHTSLVLPIKEDMSLLTRETKSPKVFIKKVNLLNNKLENDYFETDLPKSGSINPSVIAYKTPAIITENKKLIQFNNNKLLNNINKGLVDKNDFIHNLVTSLCKPSYISEKGNLYQDPKYKTLHLKILQDPKLVDNRNEIMSSLWGFSKIWHDNFSKFIDTDNHLMLKTVANFIVYDAEFIIDEELLQIISDS